MISVKQEWLRPSVDIWVQFHLSVLFLATFSVPWRADVIIASFARSVIFSDMASCSQVAVTSPVHKLSIVAQRALDNSLALGEHSPPTYCDIASCPSHESQDKSFCVRFLSLIRLVILKMNIWFEEFTVDIVIHVSCTRFVIVDGYIII